MWLKEGIPRNIYVVEYLVPCNYIAIVKVMCMMMKPGPPRFGLSRSLIAVASHALMSKVRMISAEEWVDRLFLLLLTCFGRKVVGMEVEQYNEYKC